MASSYKKLKLSARSKSFILVHKTILSALLVLSTFSSLFFASPYVFGFLAGQNTVNTSGLIADVSLGVYSDDLCVQPLTSIDWGTCYPEEAITVVVYIKNLGTVDVTLVIETNTWSPSTATSYLVFTEDGSGKIVKPGEIIQINLTLNLVAYPDQINSFSFDIIIKSQG
jgi:hypothetical protein